MQPNRRSSRSPSATTPRDAAIALHQALGDLLRVYQFRDRDRICCHDISVTQCSALETLVRQGSLRLNALAESLLLDKSTASRVVDALVRKGYVQRLADASDARAIALRATPAGRRLHERITEDLLREQQAVLADLDPEARAIAASVLARLARAAERRFAVCAPGTASCASDGSCA